MGNFHTGPLVEFLMLEPSERRRLIGQQIRETRVSNHVSQSALAQSIGVSQSYLSSVESGRKSPSPAMVTSIVHYFQKEDHSGKDEDQARHQEGD